MTRTKTRYQILNELNEVLKAAGSKLQLHPYRHNLDTARAALKQRQESYRNQIKALESGISYLRGWK